MFEVNFDGDCIEYVASDWVLSYEGLWDQGITT